MNKKEEEKIWVKVKIVKIDIDKNSPSYLYYKKFVGKIFKAKVITTNFGKTYRLPIPNFQHKTGYSFWNSSDIEEVSKYWVDNRGRK